MARKKDIYKNIDLQDVKKELRRNISYINSIDIDKIEDEIEIDYTVYGSSCIQVIERLEDKITSLIVLIKNSIDQLKHITDLDKADEFVESSLLSLSDSIDVISKYYDDKPPRSITNRTHTIQRQKKNGDTYEVKKTISNISRQIKSRSTVQKIILDLKPVLANLEQRREEEVLMKGDKQVPIAFQLFNIK